MGATMSDLASTRASTLASALDPIGVHDAIDAHDTRESRLRALQLVHGKQPLGTRSLALELRGVERAWRAGARDCHATARALDRVDLRLYAGDLLALTGAAGSGKTTLLLCAAGIIRPDRGEVTGVASAGVRYVTDVGRTHGAWVRHSISAVEDGVSVLLLDVLDPPGLAAPRAVAALAGEAAAAGIAVVVAARHVAELPAFATRLATMVAGRLSWSDRPLDAVCRAGQGGTQGNLHRVMV